MERRQDRNGEGATGSLHIGQKKEKPVEPEWATELDEWGTEKGIQEFDEAYKTEI